MMHSHHHHSHHHHHHHHAHGEESARHFQLLKTVFALTCTYLLVEIIGGILSGSLALLADGFHMFTDATAIGISLFASWFAHRPAPKHQTFGYQRMEIMAAFFNALILLGMGLFILFEGYERFQNPVSIKTNIMMAIAAGGLVINIISAKILHDEHHGNLNLKGAYLHVLGDLLGSLGALTAGAFISLLGWTWMDPLISCLIAALVLGSAIGLFKDAINVLLESCPKHLDIDEIRAAILQCEGIQNVHHLHVWNINLQRIVLTAHLEVTEDAFNGTTLNTVQETLMQRFGLSHVTLQLELA
ncbi:MAG TPA: cation diffusion facilitator family transporter [Oculatellaceae cyanobacterium]|jgi:cobalt-zinc-cadmium efflux system protein